MNKTISVYFSGTGFSIDDNRFLTSSLYHRTDETETQIKMGFDGCGVAYGLSGVIFGSGLDKQCKKVTDRLIQELNDGHHITLNVYGHSRGGIAALLLAKQLSHIDPKRLAIHLALLDPVPGNLITTSTIDPLEISLANKTMDLSDCKPLKKVLALYPHKPLADIACHAPLLVSYPHETQVEEEVVNGCHAQAEQLAHPSSKLVQLRVEEFLVQQGTALNTQNDYTDSEAMKQTYLTQYQQELNQVRKRETRSAHSSRGMVITATPGASYFNQRHLTLAEGPKAAPVCLSIEPNHGILAKINRFFTRHPFVGQILKWTSIGLSMAALLYLTGGLAAIPLLAPALIKLGAFSLLALSPLLGGTLALLWYSAAKPILSWCASQFFYPHYGMRKIEARLEQGPDSTQKLIKSMRHEQPALDKPTMTSSSLSQSTPKAQIVKNDDALEHDEEQVRTLAFT